MIDTHSHLNFNNYKEDSGEIIKECQDKNIQLVIVGSQYATSQRAVKMASNYKNGVYAAIGLHPIHLTETEVTEEEFIFKSREERFDKGKYHPLINEKVVAIGEIGLDYFHIPPGRDFKEIKKIQYEGLKSQLEFSQKEKLPVIIHCRPSNTSFDAYHDLLDILQNFYLDIKEPGKARGVIHCYAGNLEIAKKFLDLGFLISFTGIITFKNASLELTTVAREIPLNKIMVETDCPYLAPEPNRGKRCIPQYVEYTLKKIAELRKISLEEAEFQTDKNAAELFGIKI